MMILQEAIKTEWESYLTYSSNYFSGDDMVLWFPSC